MTFILAAGLLVAAGLALLRLLRLGTGSAPVDAGLAWLVGSGWFAAMAPVLRFGAALPLSRAAALAVALAPVAAWVSLAVFRRAAAAAAPGPAADRSGGEGEGRRWRPRPLWIYVPLAAYVVATTAVVLLHGASTPTHTDDAVRVRAFAPMLAFADGWPPVARNLFVMAGALPTFVPALGWILGRTVDLFHPNYAVLADLVALLLLAIGVASSRGSPERGWASAFGLLSIPLFIYHCTSTYSDAVLAMRVGAGVLFAMEYARTRSHRDAARALLLLAIAALVKREGELVAAAPATVLLAQLAAERLRGRAFPWAAIAPGAAAVALGAIGRIAAVGLSAAFPMFALFAAHRPESAVPAAVPQAHGLPAAAAGVFFGYALLRSGNAGMIYWVLPVAIAVRARALVRSGLLWPLAAVGALFAEVAVSSVWLVPEFTLDNSTVHRALLVASVPAALWIAAAMTDAARAGARAVAAGGSAPAKAAERGDGTTRRRRRRARPAFRP